MMVELNLSAIGFSKGLIIMASCSITKYGPKKIVRRRIPSIVVIIKEVILEGILDRKGCSKYFLSFVWVIKELIKKENRIARTVNGTKDFSVGINGYLAVKKEDASKRKEKSQIRQMYAFCLSKCPSRKVTMIVIVIVKRISAKPPQISPIAAVEIPARRARESCDFIDLACQAERKK